MTIRPEIQELLNRTKIRTDQVRAPITPTPRPFKTPAVGELGGPRESFHSSYLCETSRNYAHRIEKVRIEWFKNEPVPESLLALDDCVVIVHNHLADCPCYTNFGCRRVR